MPVPQDRLYWTGEAADDHHLERGFGYWVIDEPWWSGQAARLSVLEGLLDNCIGAGKSVSDCLLELYDLHMTDEERAHVCTWGDVLLTYEDTLPLAASEPQTVIPPPVMGTSVIDHDRLGEREKGYWAVEAPDPICCNGYYYGIVSDEAGNWTRSAPLRHPNAPTGTLAVELTRPTHAIQYVNLHPEANHQEYSGTGPAGYPDIAATELLPDACPDTAGGTTEELGVPQRERGKHVCIEAVVTLPTNPSGFTVTFEWADPSYQPAALRLPAATANPGVECDFGSQDYEDEVDPPTDCSNHSPPDTCDGKIPGPSDDWAAGEDWACDNRGSDPSPVGSLAWTVTEQEAAALGPSTTVHAWVALATVGGDNHRFRAVCECERGGPSDTTRTGWSPALTVWRKGAVRPDWERNDFQVDAEIAWDMSGNTHTQILGEGFFELAEVPDAKMESPTITVGPPPGSRPNAAGCTYVSPGFGFVAHDLEWDFQIGFHTGLPYLPPHKFHEINFKDRLVGDATTPSYACVGDLHWQATTDRIEIDPAKDYLWDTVSAHEMGHILIGNSGHSSQDCGSLGEIYRSLMILDCMGQPGGLAVYHFAVGEIVGKLRTQPSKE